MNYKLAALKLFCVQLKSATIAPERNAFSLGGAILFQRAWLQGVLVSDGDRFLLDDGTGVIQLNLSNEFRNRHLETGMYVMVVGGYAARADDIPMIKVHKLVDLSSFPEREPMWYLEVMEAFNILYKPLLEAYLKHDDLGEERDEIQREHSYEINQRPDPDSGPCVGPVHPEPDGRPRQLRQRHGLPHPANPKTTAFEF